MAAGPRATLAAALVALAVLRCAPAGDPLPVCASEARPDVDLIVAGTGAALPLAEHTARLLREERGLGIWVPDSIGSRGAYEALDDGVIDVGLAARTPRDGEADGSTSFAWARSPVAVVLHGATGPPPDLAQVLAAYEGSVGAWPDGTPIVPVVREDGDAGEAALASVVPRLADAMRAARASGRAVIASTDQEMATALRDTRGAIGLVDTTLVDLGAPGMLFADLGLGTTPASREWPVYKPLRLVLPANASDAARAFVSRALSVDVVELGYAEP